MQQAMLVRCVPHLQAVGEETLRNDIGNLAVYLLVSDYGVLVIAL